MAARGRHPVSPAARDLQARRNVEGALGVAVVIPVKRFDQAKSRLAPMLGPQQRQSLARAMFGDVLDAVLQVAPRASIFVVTADPEVAGIALTQQCAVIPETECAGMAAALTLGSRHVAALGYRTMLALPSDVPLVSAADLFAVLRVQPRPRGVTLVPAAGADGGRRGTNALCCSPPGLIDLCFGDDSFRRHLAAASAQREPAMVIEVSRIALDIDTPEDIAVLLRSESLRTAKRTAALLPTFALAAIAVVEAADAAEAAEAAEVAPAAIRDGAVHGLSLPGQLQ